MLAIVSDMVFRWTSEEGKKAQSIKCGSDVGTLEGKKDEIFCMEYEMIS